MAADTRHLLFYQLLAMDKDILPLQYIAALEEKYAEQVEVNRQLLKTVQELMLEISRLEERLRTRRGALSVDDLLSMADHTGEA